MGRGRCRIQKETVYILSVYCDESELGLVVAGDVVSLDLELVNGARGEVRHDEAPLHFHVVRDEGPVELVDRPILDDEVQNRATVVGPSAQPQDEGRRVRREEGRRRGDARGLALRPYRKDRRRRTAPDLVVRAQVQLVGIAAEQTLIRLRTHFRYSHRHSSRCAINLPAHFSLRLLMNRRSYLSSLVQFPLSVSEPCTVECLRHIFQHLDKSFITA
jgi:hypothetical protein